MDIFKENFHNLQIFSKNVINDLYEHYTTGASPGFERGGGKNFFFGFGNLHVAFAMRIARGQGRKSRGGWGVCSPPCFDMGGITCLLSPPPPMF